MRTILLAALLACPMWADHFVIDFFPTYDLNKLGGDPLEIGLKGSFNAMDDCQVCVLNAGYVNASLQARFDGILNIQFGTLRGTWMGFDQAGWFGTPYGSAHLAFDRVQNLLSGHIQGADGSAVTLLEGGTYGLIWAGGIQYETGTYAFYDPIEPAPAPALGPASVETPEPSTIWLALAAIAFCVITARKAR